MCRSSLVPIVPVVHRDPRRYITDPLREILERTYWLDFQRRVDHDQLLGAVRTYLQKGASLRRVSVVWRALCCLASSAVPVVICCIAPAQLPRL